MHGIYKIKVVKVSDGEELFSYHACTHPDKGDTIINDKGHKLLVSAIRHVMKEDRNGGGPVYTAFSHVEVLVAK